MHGVSAEECAVRMAKAGDHVRSGQLNIKKNGVKIMHWNPGSKHLHNKKENIESVINGYKPHILGISESNFLKHHDINDVQIDNYKLFLSDTLENENIKQAGLQFMFMMTLPVKLGRI